MGLFDFLKSKPTTEINDEVFGNLKLTEGKTSRFFSGRKIFSPVNREVEIIIIASQNNPTIDQHNFYSNLQKNYDEFKTKMTPLIDDYFKKVIDNFKIKDFDSEFRLLTIIVPDYGTKPLVWNMTFETDHDVEHFYTIDFNDTDAIDFQIDG